MIPLFRMVFLSDERDKGTCNIFAGTSMIQRADWSKTVTSLGLFFVLQYVRTQSKARWLWLISKSGWPQTTKFMLSTAYSLRTNSLYYFYLYSSSLCSLSLSCTHTRTHTRTNRKPKKAQRTQGTHGLLHHHSLSSFLLTYLNFPVMHIKWASLAALSKVSAAQLQPCSAFMEKLHQSP